MNEEIAPLKKVPEKKKGGWRSVLKELGIFALIAFGVVYPFRKYVAEPYIVSGASMDPTFETGDYLIVDKLSYETSKTAREDVVVFRYPGNPAINRMDVAPARNFIKRVIGLPDETVAMKKNVVTITNKENPNGFVLKEEYITYPCDIKKTQCIDSIEVTLGEKEYFVMGDNRAESYDSRSWGPMPEKNIVGTPILRLFPLNQIGIIPGSDSKK